MNKKSKDLYRKKKKEFIHKYNDSSKAWLIMNSQDITGSLYIISIHNLNPSRGFLNKIQVREREREKEKSREDSVFIIIINTFLSFINHLIR